jgi:hypothetical protein
MLVSGADSKLLRQEAGKTTRTSRVGDCMYQLNYICDARLPRLVWCAVLRENDDEVAVHHGRWVEVTKSSFVEGAWSGSFSEMGLPYAITFTGSGAVLTPQGLLFATPTHSVEPLYVLRVKQRLYCSNSLALILASADDDIDCNYFYYDLDITSMAFGLKRSILQIPTRNRNWVNIHYYRNFTVTKDLSLIVSQKPKARPFSGYSEYVSFLSDQVLLTIKNSADAQRLVKYAPLSTISTGYDSAATSVIAKRAGCKEFITFSKSQNGADDSGRLIGQILGIGVTEFDPATYLSRDDLPEAEFLATGGGGGSVIFTSLEDHLRGKMLLTGNYGGEAWERANNKGGADMVTWDSAGADMLYFRTRVGFLHLPVPSIGYYDYASIQRISNSEEMRPWTLDREEYDRPIPRRIVEDAGVARELFGQSKKAAARSLKYCNPVPNSDPELSKVMAATSYLSFCKYAERKRLYASKLERLLFALMHNLYCFNNRVIHSKKVGAMAELVGIALSRTPWIPIRFRKRRTRHRLLFHWGMKQVRRQHMQPAPSAYGEPAVAEKKRQGQ